MFFKEAYEALKQGAIVKLPEWAGYWRWEDNSIKMHCKDGKVLDIVDTNYYRCCCNRNRKNAGCLYMGDYDVSGKYKSGFD